MEIRINEGVIQLDTRDGLKYHADRYRDLHPEPLFIYDHAA